MGVTRVAIQPVGEGIVPGQALYALRRYVPMAGARAVAGYRCAPGQVTSGRLPDRVARQGRRRLMCQRMARKVTLAGSKPCRA
jgi:hypothetical protein